MSQTPTDLAAVVRALREHDRFLTTTHENPDGDALGSLLGLTLGLRELGTDVQMISGPDELDAMSTSASSVMISIYDPSFA